MINCKLCRNTEKCWFAGEDHEVSKCKDYIKTTNGDRIRSFPDEVLAHIAGEDAICPPVKSCLEGEVGVDCERCWLAWLKAEVTE